MFYIKTRIMAVFYRISAMTWYRFFLGKMGRHSVFVWPIRIHNPKSVEIHEDVMIDSGGWLYGVDNTNSKLIIRSGAQIGRLFHCVAYNSVEIQENVLIAERVFISDCNHEFRNIDKPILSQGLYPLSNVVIGQGTWIGENVSVVGAKIGRNCVIGANSVVTHDVDDYCVVAGNPAKVIKKYNSKTDLWEKVNE